MRYWINEIYPSYCGYGFVSVDDFFKIKARILSKIKSFGNHIIKNKGACRSNIKLKGKKIIIKVNQGKIVNENEPQNFINKNEQKNRNKNET